MGMKVSTKEGIKLLAALVGKSLAQISREMGYKMPTYLVNMVSRGSVRAGILARIAEVCGYELMLVPKGTEIDNSITIKGEKEDVE